MNAAGVGTLLGDRLTTPPGADASLLAPLGPLSAPDARQRVPRRTRRAAALALVLLLACCWTVSGFWESVDLRSPRAAYPSPLAGIPWVQAPGASAHSFFRLRVALDAPPEVASFWVEADQQAMVYVNGFRVVGLPSAVSDEADLLRAVQVFDLRGALVRGDNVVGVEVINQGRRNAAFRAVLDLVAAGHAVNLGGEPAQWRATGNVALTDQEMPLTGPWSVAGFDDSAWPVAQSSVGHAGPSTSGVPPGSYTLPDAGTIVVARPGVPAIASTTLDVPPGCGPGWLRVAASGPYSVAWDGRTIATSQGGRTLFGDPNDLASDRATPTVQVLDLYDISPFLTQAGPHRISVVVTAGNPARLYVDGAICAAHGAGLPVGSAGWAADGAVSSAGTAARAFFAAFELRPAIDVYPTVLEVRLHLLLAGELLGVMVGGLLLAFALARAARPSVVLPSLAAGALPATGVVALCTQLRHIMDITPPFPTTPAVLAAVMATWAAGAGLAVLWSARRARQLRPVPSHLPPSRAPLRERGPRRRPQWSERNCRTAVCVFAAGWALAQSYDLTFGPLWQDELSSLAAALGIRAHVVPEWPSGFIYWKSELYSALIAAAGALTHDSTSLLRAISVLWFGATVIIFGTRVMPMVLPGRPGRQLFATVLFALAPLELAQARELRMYQMAQCIAVVLSCLLYEAIRRQTTGTVLAAMAATVALYLTHEESFGIVVLVPILVTVMARPLWARKWQWWAFGAAAYGVIAAQLALATFTHPPYFGVDDSNGPVVAWSPAPWYYVNQYFFKHSTYGASVTVVSLLAVVGLVNALRRRDTARLYFASFLVFPMFAVSCWLPAKDTRYAFIMLPFLFVCGAAGASDVYDLVRRATCHLGTDEADLWARSSTAVFALLAMVALVASTTGSLGDFGVLVAKLTGADIAEQHPDYAASDSYVRDHLEPGDVVIAACTPNLVALGLGRPPGYWMPQRRASRLLYLIEKNGEAVDTQYGIPVINDGWELERVVEEHRRVWLVAYDGYLPSYLSQERQVLETRFRLVEEAAKVSVFLSG